MFQSLNLFKSTNCPYYSASSNTLTCDRPYCLFRHPTLQLSSNHELNTASNSTLLNLPQNLDFNSLTQLPNLVENLTNALQTVKNLLNSKNISEIAKLNTQTSTTTTTTTNETQEAETTSKLTSTIQSLNNAIMSVSNNNNNNNNTQTTDSEQSVASNKKASNLKRQLSAPPYNPTPINELKKIKELENINIKHKLEPQPNHQEGSNLGESKRRKIGSQSWTEPKLSDCENDEDENFDEAEVKLKEKTDIKKLEIEKSEVKTKIEAPKFDMKSFNKLSLNQQILKRYEIMNIRPTITAPGLMGSNVKKGDEASKKEDVPHLIIDASSSAPKIPLVMRQRYLKIIFENCKSSFASVPKACEKAAEQEKSIYDRSKSKSIYLNLCANLVKSLRTQNSNGASSGSTSGATSINNNSRLVNGLPKHMAKPTTTYSHEAMMNGPKANRVSYSINRVKQIEIKDLTVLQLYKMFYTYVLTEKQLEDNCFPKWMTASPDATPTKTLQSTRLAYIPNYHTNNNNKKSSSTDLQSNSSTTNNGVILTKTCKRCNRTFSINGKDLSYLATNTECVHHWGKLRNVRINKVVEQKYSCCSGDMNSDGCEIGKHVYDGEYDGDCAGVNLKGYVETLDNSHKEVDVAKRQTSTNIYALDCEMCYTTRGLELTRVSIVDINMKEIYESLVKPDAQIIDYNTRWSGLTEKSLKNCNKKLKNVQADLLRLINKDTILIGHSLDSDFKALKLIHKNVIDTSVVFPHKMGPPYKRALRNLMSEHLQKIIQEDAEGHDSKEDANSCIELMLWKISEDLKNSKKLSAIMLTPSDSNLKSTNTTTQATTTTTTTIASSHHLKTSLKSTLASSSTSAIKTTNFSSAASAIVTNATQRLINSNAAINNNNNNNNSKSSSSSSTLLNPHKFFSKNF